MRYDALGEEQDGTFGHKNKEFLEHRLETIEGDFVKSISKPNTKKFQKYHAGEKRGRDYNEDGDFQGPKKRAKNFE